VTSSLAVVAVTHDNPVLDAATRALLMEDGRLRAPSCSLWQPHHTESGGALLDQCSSVRFEGRVQAHTGTPTALSGVPIDDSQALPDRCLAVATPS